MFHPTTGRAVNALVFDTETSDVVDFKAKADHPDQPWPLEIAWSLIDTESWRPLHRFVSLVAVPPEVLVSQEAFNKHNISADEARAVGLRPETIFSMFAEAFELADFAVCHSWNFDRRIMAALAHRLDAPEWDAHMKQSPHLCTMMASTPVCQLSSPKSSRHKWPTLGEAYSHFTDKPLSNGAHRADVDVAATCTVLRGLVEGNHVDLDGIVS